MNIVITVIVFLALMLGVNYFMGGDSTDVVKQKMLIEGLNQAIDFQKSNAESLQIANNYLVKENDSLYFTSQSSKKDYNSLVSSDAQKIGSLRAQLNSVLEDTTKTPLQKVTAERDFLLVDAGSKSIQIHKLESAYADLESLALKRADVIVNQKNIIAGLNRVIAYQDQKSEAYEKILQKYERLRGRFVMTTVGVSLIMLAAGALFSGA